MKMEDFQEILYIYIYSDHEGVVTMEYKGDCVFFGERCKMKDEGGTAREKRAIITNLSTTSEPRTEPFIYQYTAAHISEL